MSFCLIYSICLLKKWRVCAVLHIILVGSGLLDYWTALIWLFSYFWSPHTDMSESVHSESMWLHSRHTYTLTTSTKRTWQFVCTLRLVQGEVRGCLAAQSLPPFSCVCPSSALSSILHKCICVFLAEVSHVLQFLGTEACNPANG